jgi:hypothetical protein
MILPLAADGNENGRYALMTVVLVGNDRAEDRVGVETHSDQSVTSVTVRRYLSRGILRG